MFPLEVKTPLTQLQKILTVGKPDDGALKSQITLLLVKSFFMYNILHFHIYFSFNIIASVSINVSTTFADPF